jgi:hypothetical protein
MKSNPSNEEDAVKRMLKEAGLESPSRDFTSNLMQLLAPETKPKFIGQPVFNKNQVYFFTSLFGSFFLYALFSGSTYSLGSKLDLSEVDELTSSIQHLLYSPLLLVVLISGCSLYILDKWMNRAVHQA